MKKVIYAVVFVLSISAVYAQGIGLKAGLNMANQSVKVMGISASANSLMGFHFGVVGEFGLSESLYFSPGLLYSGKGSKTEGDDKTIVSYINIPLDLVAKFNLGGPKALFRVGPDIGYAISGKNKGDGYDVDIEFGSDEDQMKRLDFGLNIGAGIDISALQIDLTYTIGLADLTNVDEYKMKNKNFAISVAYFFNRGE